MSFQPGLADVEGGIGSRGLRDGEEVIMWVDAVAKGRGIGSYALDSGEWTIYY